MGYLRDSHLLLSLVRLADCGGSSWVPVLLASQWLSWMGLRALSPLADEGFVRSPKSTECWSGLGPHRGSPSCSEVVGPWLYSALHPIARVRSCDRWLPALPHFAAPTSPMNTTPRCS